MSDYFIGNPNIKTDEGLTPLHIAAMWGYPTIVKLLLVSAKIIKRNFIFMIIYVYLFLESWR